MNSQANQPHRIGALVRDVALFWGGERQPQMHFPCNSVSRAIENQQLVLGEQRFGDHRAKAARPQQASERHNKVHEKGGQVTHDPRSAPTTPVCSELVLKPRQADGIGPGSDCASGRNLDLQLSVVSSQFFHWVCHHPTRNGSAGCCRSP